MDKAKADRFPLLLLLSVFVVATCGLVYELVAGTLASYLLGDSVTQFSTIIGAYLFSMGIGSYLSRYFNRNLLAWFIQIEILVGLVGGISSTLLFLLFDMVEGFRILLYGLVAVTGILVGLEIPLLMRILENRFEFKDLVAKVFTFDYIGALLASIVFPLLLVPFLGLIRTSFLFGMMNVLVAFIVCSRFREEVQWARYLAATSVAVLLLLLTGFVLSEKIMSFAEGQAYSDRIIFTRSSPYQRIVLTKNKRELRLFLNGNLQFSSADEYRYHESLVHPGLQAIEKPEKVLIMGGGDGLALREVLKHPGVKEAVLVDLDKEMTDLFSNSGMLTALNDSSLHSRKARIINADAFRWLKNQREQFDFIIIDFPDPSNYSIGKLYTSAFYNLVHKALSPGGLVVVQSTSPYVAPQSFWCVNKTLESTGFHTYPYHAFVPSFGDWGYIMAAKDRDYSIPGRFPEGLRYISPSAVAQMMYFPRDMARVDTDVNKLNNQALVHYFEDEWSKFIQ
jgi:spermidine synthase